MGDDIMIIVGDSLEEVRALASDDGLEILYERRFGSVDTEHRDPAWGHIARQQAGALAIAK